MLDALRSLSLKPISFGYKTPPIRFSQAGGQAAHKARPPQPSTRVDVAVGKFRQRLSLLKDSAGCLGKVAV